MATPTPVTVNVPSGTTQIALGRNISLPVTLPDPNTWAAISLNVPNDIDPEDDPAVNLNFPADADWHLVEGFPGLIDDWCGGVYASGVGGANGSLVLHGGGHNGYGGNEIIAFSFDTFLWSRITDPTPIPGTLDYTWGELTPEEPMSTHTYDGLTYNPNSNELLLHTITTPHIQGCEAKVFVAHVFDFDTLQWRRGGTFTGNGNSCAIFSDFDVSRGVTWCSESSQSPFKTYNFSTDVFTSHGNVDATTEDDWVARIYPAGDAFIMYRNGVLKGRDLASPTTAEIVLNASGSPPLDVGVGFDWCHDLSAFVAWIGGANLYKLTPPTGNWRTGTWVWSTLTPSSGTPDAINVTNTYGRFRWIPAIGCFALINRTSGQVWAYKPVV